MSFILQKNPYGHFGKPNNLTVEEYLRFLIVNDDK